MDKEEKKNWLERIVLWISAGLVAATLVFLIYENVSVQPSSPNILISYDQMEAKGEYYALQVTVKNAGAKTAENVQIEITAGRGENPEKSQLQFQYLPGRSSVKGWTTFRKKVDKKDIEAHVIGYVTP